MALVYASGGRTLCASRSIAQVGDLSAPVQCNTVGKRSRPAGLGGPSCGTLEGRPSDSAMCRQKRDIYREVEEHGKQLKLMAQEKENISKILLWLNVICWGFNFVVWFVLGVSLWFNAA